MASIQIYDFSFAVTRKAVFKERLVKITSTSEKVLYDRRDSKPNFASSLAKDTFLQFAFRERGTINFFDQSAGDVKILQ